MPYEYTFVAQNTAPDRSGAAVVAATVPLHTVTLWPHRSLPRTGFVWFIGLTAAMIALPLISLIGSPVLWGMLPFLLLAIAAVWWALERSYSDRNITEHLAIWPDRMTLHRIGPRNKRADWNANPYWVTPVLHATGGPVPNYVTLRGGDREVELGAFLSEAERLSLHAEVGTILRTLR